jgi:hypothetical protein
MKRFCNILLLLISIGSLQIPQIRGKSKKGSALNYITVVGLQGSLTQFILFLVEAFLFSR